MGRLGGPYQAPEILTRGHAGGLLFFRFHKTV